MPARVKKLIALVVMLPGVTAYFFAAAALGERLPAMEIFRVPYYLTAGLAWALPVRYLLVWANSEPVSKRDR